MINLQLVPRKQNPEKLVLAFNHSFRYFFYVPALFFIAMLMMDDKNTGSNMGPLIIAAVLFLCGSYHEAWIFDRDQKSVEHQLGFIFLFRRNRFSMDEIRSVKLVGLLHKRVKGSGYNQTQLTARTTLTKLVMVKNDGKIQNVEIVKGKNAVALEKKAELIASFCEVALHTNEA